jgi:DNA-binding MarR family transcriptional regulator
MLANDIKQTKSFRSEHHKVLVNIQLTNFWILEQVKSIIENENITYQQYNILCILRNSIIPLSTKELSKRMLDKMSDTSRLIDRLVLKGLAEKKMSMIDKRLVDISITQKGMEILETIDEHNEKIDKITENLSTEELQLLNRFLDNLHNSKN